VAKRAPSASLCEGTLPPDQHPGRLFQKNPNLYKTSSGSGSGGSIKQKTPPPIVANIIATTANSSTTAVVQNGKKPLTRLMKSSPGKKKDLIMIRLWSVCLLKLSRIFENFDFFLQICSCNHYIVMELSVCQLTI
jgi:hypothetical protein